MTKAAWGGLGLIQTMLPHRSSSRLEVRTGTQAGQDPGDGADAEGMEGGLLLACCSWLAQPGFFKTKNKKTGPPVQGWHHPQCAGPSPINH